MEFNYTFHYHFSIHSVAVVVFSLLLLLFRSAESEFSLPLVFLHFTIGRVLIVFNFILDVIQRKRFKFKLKLYLSTI